MALDENLTDGEGGHIAAHAALKAEYDAAGATPALPTYTAYGSTHNTIHAYLHARHNALGAATTLPLTPGTTGHLAHHAALHIAYNLRQAQPATVPATPSAPTVSAGNATITVSWLAPSNGGSPITGYDVQPFIGATGGTVVSVGNVLSTTLTGMVNGTVYTVKVRAKNAVGSGAYSSASANVSPVLVTPVSIPADVWGMWTFLFSDGVAIRNYPPDVLNTSTHLILGMAQSGSSGTGTLGFGNYVPGYTTAQLQADIASYKSSGKHVLMGIGGSNDGGITITTPTQVTQAYNSIVGFVNTWGITGIDLDLEPSGSSWNQTSLVSLVTQLKTTYGGNFCVSVTAALYDPYQAPWMSLAAALGNNLDLFGVMLYDFPEAASSALNSVVTSKAAYMASNGIPQSKMLMGYMGQMNAAYVNGTGQKMSSPPQVIVNAHAAGLASYPNIRGGFFWENKIDNEQGWVYSRRAGQSINPASSTGVLIMEPFTTEATGSTPQFVMLGRTPTGGGASIISNKLDFATGAAGGFAGTDKVSRRLTANNSTGLSVADIDMRFDMVNVTSEPRPEVVVRSPETAWDGGGTGYLLVLNNGQIKIVKAVASVFTDLATASFTYTQGTTYKVRFRVVGTTLQGFIGTTLPTTPTVSITDSSITAAGFASFAVGGGSAAVSQHTQIDNLYVTNGS